MEATISAIRKPSVSRPHTVGRAEDLGSIALALLSERGEASGVALAKQILNAYAGFDANERLTFLRILAQCFGPDPVRLESAIERYRANPGPRASTELFAAAEPPRQELIRR